MEYQYRGFRASISPIRDPKTSGVLYWRYKIYDNENDTYLFDGYDHDQQSAAMTAEAHIDRLVVESQEQVITRAA